MSFLSIIAPESGKNWALNPSAEATGNFASHSGSTVTRTTTNARYGNYQYSITAAGANDGINLTLSALANAVHHVTGYFRKGTAITGNLQASLDSGSTWNTMSAVDSVGTGEWGRYQVSIPAAQANGSTSLLLRSTDNENWRLDAVQVEATDGYFTTYIDGDLEGSFPGSYRWAGLKHASTSTRSAQERNGGRERDLLDDFGIGLLKNNYNGIGLPPLTLNMQPLALQSGAIHQSTKLHARNANFQLDLEGTSYQAMHQKRQNLIDLVGPHQVRGDQAFTLGFKGANTARTAFGRYRYSGGLGFTQPTTFTEQLFLSIIAVDADFFADDRGTASLDFTDSDTDADRAMARIDGAWASFGTGFDSNIFVIAIDQERNRVYFGGGFANANGAAHSNITYWDGNDFVTMGAGVNGSVVALKIAPNGDVWVGGTFTQAGGVNSFGLAKWDVSASSWVQFTNGTSGDDVFAIAINSAGRIYIGGAFLNWDSVAAADRIAQSTDDGANWTALSTGVDDIVTALAVDQGDNLYVGGDFTTAGAASHNRITKWDGTTFIDMANGVDSDVDAIAIGKDGKVYFGGDFTTDFNHIAYWDGSTLNALGVGVGGDVFEIAIAPDGTLIAVGTFTSAGGINIADRIAGWNGSSWFHIDIDLPGSPTTEGLAINEYGDIYVGYSVAGTATLAGRTTVTNNGTAKVSPVITILGTTTANSTSTLQWLENQSAGTRLYFNLTINTDEIITIDTRPGSVGIFSNFRGEITDNPLPPGGLSLFALLPGDNVIATFMTGTTTGAEILIHWDIKHISVDGVA